MADAVEVGGLKVAKCLYQLVEDEISPGTGVNGDVFWSELGEIVRDLGEKNRALLETRDALQKQIDDWHLARKGKPIRNGEVYKEFLTRNRLYSSRRRRFSRNDIQCRCGNRDHRRSAIGCACR